MSEYLHVEKPFLDWLSTLGWTVINQGQGIIPSDPAESWSGHTSTVMINQLPTDKWYVGIGDNTLADAILGRLMYNAHRLQLKGESMRIIMGQLTDDEHLG